MMLRTLQVNIQKTNGALTFNFDAPLRIYTLTVSTMSGDLIWKIIPEALKPANYRGASLAVPVDVSQPTELDDLAFNDDEPIPVEPLSSIVYGAVPAGFKEKRSASALRDGSEYNLGLIAHEGHATVVFTA